MEPIKVPFAVPAPFDSLNVENDVALPLVWDTPIRSPAVQMNDASAANVARLFASICADSIVALITSGDS